MRQYFDNNRSCTRWPCLYQELIMTTIKTGPTPSRLFAAAPDQRKGGMFYRWHLRRERIRELSQLLSLDPHLLADAGVTADQIRAEILVLRRKPV